MKVVRINNLKKSSTLNSSRKVEVSVTGEGGCVKTVSFTVPGRSEETFFEVQFTFHEYMKLFSDVMDSHNEYFVKFMEDSKK